MHCTNALFLQLENMHPQADDATVSRHLEAYLLWLFGWTMFTSTHGNTVDRTLIRFAREIADSDPHAVPQYSWASAVLAATYRGLCDACTKTDANAVLTGCPLLLQLWSYEHISVGRPLIDLTSYDNSFYGPFPEDAPTMGTLWCRRRVSTLYLMFIDSTVSHL